MRYSGRALIPLLIDTYKTRLNNVVDEIGKVHFWNYMRKVIEENELLTKAQKEDLLDTSDPVKLWKNERPLMRLMLVMLGVLCYKPAINN